MALPEQPRMTRDEFIAWELAQPLKYEFWQGEVFPMTGARQAHVIVAGNCFSLLKAHLRGGPCRAYISDMQLEVAAADAVFYPDVFVSCDPADLAADRTLSRAKLIVEVLSDSTAGFDRGAKFAAYRRLETLQEYVLVDPQRLTVEIFRRTETGDWLLATHDGERGLVLRSIDFEASLIDVFEAVEGGAGTP
jgi:Uma2 family endonuclease